MAVIETTGGNGNGSKRPKRLGDILIAAGLITQEQLEEALAKQKGSGKRLGTVLQEEGYITELEMIEALQMQLGIEFIDLNKINIPTELAQVVPANIAKQYQVVPVRIIRDELYLAMSDPLKRQFWPGFLQANPQFRSKVVPIQPHFVSKDKT